MRRQGKVVPSLVLAAVLAGGVALAGPSEEDADGGGRDGKDERVKVAVLIFEGVELLDFAGPAEVFVVAAKGKAFDVYTVAATAKPVRVMGGLTVVPNHALADAPAPDILVLPGGNLQAVDDETLAWVKKTSAEADHVMSVCFGAFLLARAGLLDGIEATTHHWGIDDLRKASPTCTVVTGRRFVESGKILSTAGVTAGIDGALRLVEKILGAEAALWTAREWMEYESWPGREGDAPSGD